jgi:hypothetical protein
MQYVAERLLVQFQLPYHVAEQQVEIRVEPVEPPGEPAERKLDSILGCLNKMVRDVAEGPQARADGQPVIALAEADPYGVLGRE